MDPTTREMSDGECVLQVANDLNMSEFEVVRRAYNDCYGREMEPQALESGFAHNLRFGKAPRWVRYYARMIMDAPRQPTIAMPMKPPTTQVITWLSGFRIRHRFLMQ
jgi:hypothetical protein